MNTTRLLLKYMKKKMKTYQLLENTDIAVNEDVVDILEPVTEHTRELA